MFTWRWFLEKLRFDMAQAVGRGVVDGFVLGSKAVGTTPAGDNPIEYFERTFLKEFQGLPVPPLLSNQAAIPQAVTGPAEADQNRQGSPPERRGPGRPRKFEPGLDSNANGNERQ